jgi:hypothetical protein
MLAPGPWVKWDCIVKILKAESVEVIEFSHLPDLAFAIPKGDIFWPWPIRKNHASAGPEIESLFLSVGLSMANLQTLQDMHCTDRYLPDGSPIN